MSGVSLPVTRPIGRALVIANSTSRVALVDLLARIGFDCGECDDPYTASMELSRRRLTYRAVILSLASLYKEELGFIATVKRRFPHIEIWLAHTDGRQAALAESMRLGADGLFDVDGLHRIAAPQPSDTVYQVLPQSPSNVQFQSVEPSQQMTPMPVSSDMPEGMGEPVLTSEELRALLQDQPAMPPSSGEET